jgi:arsenate reductase (glutaredoxin)
MITVYFKPDCSKCVATGCLLEEQNIEFQKVEYLSIPPSRTELIAIIQKLGIRANELIRKNEAIYVEKYAGKPLSEDESIDAMLEDPILIERPILIEGDKAMICRPPEKLFEFLKNR